MPREGALVRTSRWTTLVWTAADEFLQAGRFPMADAIQAAITIQLGGLVAPPLTRQVTVELENWYAQKVWPTLALGRALTPLDEYVNPDPIGLLDKLRKTFTQHFYELVIDVTRDCEQRYEVREQEITRLLAEVERLTEENDMSWQEILELRNKLREELERKEKAFFSLTSQSIEVDLRAEKRRHEWVVGVDRVTALDEGEVELVRYLEALRKKQDKANERARARTVAAEPPTEVLFALVKRPDDWLGELEWYGLADQF